MLPKNPTYTFIHFQQKIPPICLFPPILLLVFKEISHLYFYSELSSIRNSRVVFPDLKCTTLKQFTLKSYTANILIVEKATFCCLLFPMLFQLQNTFFRQFLDNCFACCHTTWTHRKHLDVYDF